MGTQIGSYTPQMREVHGDLITTASLIFVDSIYACSTEAGELIDIPKDRLLEIGKFSCSEKSMEYDTGDGAAKPRESHTVFKSVGVGMQDVAIAALVVKRAKHLGLGSVVPY
jgi:ornithine cyclodeaminase